jgi:hypothetical protein
MEYIFNFTLILYFKHNGMSSTKYSDYSFTVRTTVMTSIVVLRYARQHRPQNIKIYGSIISLIFLLVTPSLALRLPAGPTVGVLF